MFIPQMSIIIIFNLPKIGVGWARTTMKLSCFPNCIFRIFFLKIQLGQMCNSYFAHFCTKFNNFVFYSPNGKDKERGKNTWQ